MCARPHAACEFFNVKHTFNVDFSNADRMSDPQLAEANANARILGTRVPHRARGRVGHRADFSVPTGRVRRGTLSVSARPFRGAEYPAESVPFHASITSAEKSPLKDLLQ